ncbi:MAG: Smr/MutS family protein [Polaromonas sp.]
MPAPSSKPSKSSQFAKRLLLRDFKDLKLVKRELEARARLEQALKAARLAATVKARSEKELFSRAVGPVLALSLKHRPGHKASLQHPRPAPIPEQHQRDELAVMQEALSDEFDVETLLDTDEALSFRRPGMGPDVVRKLRRGNWNIQRHLDLHGFRREDARNALAAFVREASKAGLRCVRVVHGKGLGSPGKAPVLKGRVQSWLIQKQEVLAFVQARPAEGGAGALVVLLAQS